MPTTWSRLKKRMTINAWIVHLDKGNQDEDQCHTILKPKRTTYDDELISISFDSCRAKYLQKKISWNGTIEICFQQYATLSIQPFCTDVLISLLLVIIICFTSGFEIKLKNSFSLLAMRVIAQTLGLLILYKNFVVLHLPLPKSYPCWLFIRQPSLHSFAAKMQYAFVKDV